MSGFELGRGHPVVRLVVVRPSAPVEALEAWLDKAALIVDDDLPVAFRESAVKGKLGGLGLLIQRRGAFELFFEGFPGQGVDEAHARLRPERIAARPPGVERMSARDLQPEGVHRDAVHRLATSTSTATRPLKRNERKSGLTRRS